MLKRVKAGVGMLRGPDVLLLGMASFRHSADQRKLRAGLSQAGTIDEASARCPRRTLGVCMCVSRGRGVWRPDSAGDYRLSFLPAWNAPTRLRSSYVRIGTATAGISTNRPDHIEGHKLF